MITDGSVLGTELAPLGKGAGKGDLGKLGRGKGKIKPPGVPQQHQRVMKSCWGMLSAMLSE